MIAFELTTLGELLAAQKDDDQPFLLLWQVLVYNHPDDIPAPVHCLFASPEYDCALWASSDEVAQAFITDMGTSFPEMHYVATAFALPDDAPLDPSTLVATGVLP